MARKLGHLQRHSQRTQLYGAFVSSDSMPVFSHYCYYEEVCHGSDQEYSDNGNSAYKAVGTNGLRIGEERKPLLSPPKPLVI